MIRPPLHTHHRHREAVQGHRWQRQWIDRNVTVRIRRRKREALDVVDTVDILQQAKELRPVYAAAKRPALSVEAAAGDPEKSPKLRHDPVGHLVDVSIAIDG